MSADNCGYCGASLIYRDGTYVCPDCTLTLGEQREIRRYIRDNNTPHNELPVWLVSLIARAEAAEARFKWAKDFIGHIMILGLLRGSPRLRDEALMILDGIEPSKFDGTEPDFNK